eukprot:2897119-Prymnesium_polylepis.1
MSSARSFRSAHAADRSRRDRGRVDLVPFGAQDVTVVFMNKYRRIFVPNIDLKPFWCLIELHAYLGDSQREFNENTYE